MTATRALVLDFTCSGYLDSLAQALVSFVLRHLPNSFKIVYLKYSTKIEHNKVLFQCKKKI